MHSKEEFLDFIEKEISKNNLIIVEGKKDFDSLIKIGFSKKNIFVLNNGKPFITNIEEIESLSDKRKCKTQEKQDFSGPRKFRKFSRVSILTDFDKKGKMLYAKIKENLLHKEKIDDSLRLQILKQKISHIEGLYSYLNA